MFVCAERLRECWAIPMREPPVLGLTNTQVVWRDGAVVCGGILGRVDPETLAQERAERERKEELRAQPNVILLEDWRQSG